MLHLGLLLAQSCTVSQYTGAFYTLSTLNTVIDQQGQVTSTWHAPGTANYTFVPMAGCFFARVKYRSDGTTNTHYAINHFDGEATLVDDEMSHELAALNEYGEGLETSRGIGLVGADGIIRYHQAYFHRGAEHARVKTEALVPMGLGAKPQECPLDADSLLGLRTAPPVRVLQLSNGGKQPVQSAWEASWLNITSVECNAGSVSFAGILMANGESAYIAAATHPDGTKFDVSEAHTVSSPESPARYSFTVTEGYLASEGAIHWHSVRHGSGIGLTQTATLFDVVFTRPNEGLTPPLPCALLAATTWTSVVPFATLFHRIDPSTNEGSSSPPTITDGSSLQLTWAEQADCLLTGNIMFSGPAGTTLDTVGAIVHKVGPALSIIDVTGDGLVTGVINADIECVTGAKGPRPILHYSYVGDQRVPSGKLIYDADLECTCPNADARRLLFANVVDEATKDTSEKGEKCNCDRLC